MKVLLDENLPHDLRHLLPGHEVLTVTFMGYCGLKNGELLRQAAADGFDVMISIDAGLRHQHNLETLPCAIMLLHTTSNRLESLAPIFPKVAIALSTLQPCTFVEVV